MPALDLIRPSVTAMRVIASVNDGFARELKLPSHIRTSDSSRQILTM
ncbi:ethanolamine utilization polyhedral-body-like protein EutL [Klebsiella pneumoniae]|uniref:Ethanolamine utilization polyhedral-body-like protein EutL n=1 Tax=Klebsiella pneumoniae TaxID=573 RepID=A0A377XC42_KLEPN|nr:ethanolamine utilization polyhedral-body-like protein EutL [Klebsiella pneumoniae]